MTLSDRSEYHASTSAIEKYIAEVHRALQAQDFERAKSLARAALDKNHIHPLFLNLRAYWFEERKLYREALKDLRKASVLAPHDITILNALGLCLVRCHEIPGAIEAFVAALRLQPDFAPARFNLAWTFELAGDLSAAKASYFELVRIHPNHADALGGIAFLLARLGDWKAAYPYANRALELVPQQPTASLALAAHEIETGEGRKAELRITQLLENAALTEATKALALGMLGDALDKDGRFPEAFIAYQNANRELVALHRETFAGPKMESALDYVRKLSHLVQRTRKRSVKLAMPLKTDPEEPSRHIFIVGFPRSGTTLLEQVLGSHPLAITTEEKDTLGDAVLEFMTRPEYLMKWLDCDATTVDKFRGAYWEKLRKAEINYTGRILIDKLPLNTIKLPLIVRMFPHAKILFAVRDPRDVVLSCFRRRFTMNASMYEFLSLNRAAQYYSEVMSLAELYGKTLSIDMHLVRHEDILDSFGQTIRAACLFAGIEWHDDMAKFSDRAKSRNISTPSGVQLVRGLNNMGHAQWRNYWLEMAPIAPILNRWIMKFGYAPDSSGSL